ncbi:MAG TPA: hypothetical protein VEG38_05675 [Acidimicrobiia bacterium]|nr:hypothetical protein [Acidimicrobiia bacterium]
MGMRTIGLARGRRLGDSTAEGRTPDRVEVVRSFKFRGDAESLLSTLAEPAPLPPLPPAPRPELTAAVPAVPEAPGWSPVTIALPLFALVWACFAALGTRVAAPPAAEVAGLARLLATGAAIMGLVLVTLAVADAQISRRGPRPGVLGVVALAATQGLAAAVLGSGGHTDLWGVAAWVFVLVGVAVPLAWVGGQFQCGVRRQRVERTASLTASWIERARRQAHQTVESVHRHDVRSMLFVIDGAARTLVDGTLTAEQRASFGEMLNEGVQRLGALMDVRSEDVQPFAVEDVARAVAHAERKSGRRVTVDLPAGLTAVGRAADVAAVLRTLVDVTSRKHNGDVQVHGEVRDGAIVVRVAPAGETDALPLVTANWEEVWAESFKPSRQNDEESVDLYVAARLLNEQGADVWSSAGRARFAVRLPIADSHAREEA